MADATYHVQIWGETPEYLCLPCGAGDMTLASVTTHLQEVHQLDAVPTVAVAHLLQLGGHSQGPPSVPFASDDHYLGE